MSKLRVSGYSAKILIFWLRILQQALRAGSRRARLAVSRESWKRCSRAWSIWNGYLSSSWSQIRALLTFLASASGSSRFIEWRGRWW
jgi:hypothetical protein